MPGQGGLDGDFGGFPVADFTYQNDIRVLADDRPEAAREGEVDFGIDLYLTDAFDLILNGVFDGNNVDIRPVDRL